jgi:hypothetical protein
MRLLRAPWFAVQLLICVLDNVLLFWAHEECMKVDCDLGRVLVPGMHGVRMFRSKYCARHTTAATREEAA